MEENLLARVSASDESRQSFGHNLMRSCSIACVVNAYLREQGEHLCSMFLFEFRMIKEREHEGKVEDFERKSDAQLSLYLLQKRFDEPLDRHLGVIVEQVGKVCHEKLSDGWVKWCFDQRKDKCTIHGQGSFLLHVDKLLKNLE